MSKTYLKIKIKSLAVEAQIIRKEENKFKAGYRALRNYADNLRLNATYDVDAEYERQHAIFWGLRNHRTFDVRNEARAALLAYGFVRGLAYRIVENPAKGNLPGMNRVYDLVLKYGPQDKYTSTIDNVKKVVDKWMDIPVSAELARKAQETKLAARVKKKEQREQAAA